MAKKVNASRLAEISRGHAEVTNRWPTPVSPALYLIQLRLPKLRISPSKRKLQILVDPGTRDQMEHPVQIRHVA